MGNRQIWSSKAALERYANIIRFVNCYKSPLSMAWAKVRYTKPTTVGCWTILLLRGQPRRARWERKN